MPWHTLMTRRQCIPARLNQYVNHDPWLIFKARLVFKALPLLAQLGQTPGLYSRPGFYSRKYSNPTWWTFTSSTLLVLSVSHVWVLYDNRQHCFQWSATVQLVHEPLITLVYLSIITRNTQSHSQWYHVSLPVACRVIFERLAMKTNV